MTRDSRIKNALVKGGWVGIGKEGRRGLAQGGYVVLTARCSLLRFQARMFCPPCKAKGVVNDIRIETGFSTEV